MPTISIIMPVYGVEKYIATAIESVLAQTYPDWELIVVNDGTKDNSRAIALQYAATDSRIKVCDKENGGLSDARNFGLNIAKGQYVHFFDSDDRIAPDFYEQMLKPFIDNSALDFIVSGYNKENFLVNGKTSYEIFRIDESLAPYKLESQYFNYAWNKLFNRDFIERHGLRFEYGLKLIEDIEFMSRVVACSPKYQFVDYFGYYYAIRERETLSKYFDLAKIELTARRQKLMGSIFNHWNLKKNQLDSNIEISKLHNVISLFCSLFYECDINSFKFRKNCVASICQNTILSPNLNIELELGFYKNLIRYLVARQQVSILVVIYSIIAKLRAK